MDLTNTNAPRAAAGNCNDSVTNEERKVEALRPILTSHLERVLEKEIASLKAVCSLKGILIQIQKNERASRNHDLRSWCELVSSLWTERANFQYVIGVAGDTGTGKSSLLNALLSEYAEVAPSSQHGACTAAVCCFLGRSRCGGTEPKHSAKVYLKSKDTVDHELALFFAELNEFELRMATEDTYDGIAFGEREKFNEKLNIIRGWTGISKQRLQDLGRNGFTEEITLSCENKEELFDFDNPRHGKVIEIKEESSKAFLKAVKQYVGSTGRSTQTLRWPLVAKVEVFVDSELLRNGVVLVDLPGETDALDSRSQVAREFYNKLDSQMIITPGDRALDNKTAIELLRDDQILDMEADGLIRESGICVVVTKADLMDWRSFSDNEADPASISDDFEELQAQVGKLELALDRLGQDPKPTADEPNPNDSAHFIRARDELKLKLSRLEALCLRRCIEFRNKDTKKSFERYFDRIRNSGRAKAADRVSTDLEVFSVSSKAHQALARGKPEPAFEEAGSSGIDALKAWIINASLQKREEHADHILHRCQVLFDAIHSWAAGDVFTGVRLPVAKQSEFLALMNVKQKQLSDRMQRDMKNYGARNDRLLMNVTLGSPVKNEGSENSFVQHVQNFACNSDRTQLHWSTYAACIRRRGGAFQPYSKPCRTHNWQARIYGLFWSPHALLWGQAYGPSLMQKYMDFEQKLYNLAVAFTQDMVSDRNIPDEFKAVFRSHAYRVENVFADLRAKIKKTITEHRHDARQIKHKSRDILALKMQAAYDAANKINGPGKFGRQQTVMVDHAKSMKTQLFKEASEDIDKKLRNARNGLKRRQRTIANKAFEKIAELIDGICVCLCSTEQQSPGDGGTEPSPLQRCVLEETRAWRQFWDKFRTRLPPIKIELYQDEEEICDSTVDTEDAQEHVEKEEDREDGQPITTKPVKKAATKNNTSKKRAAKGNGAGAKKVTKQNAKSTPRSSKGKAAAKSDAVIKDSDAGSGDERPAIVSTKGSLAPAELSPKGNSVTENVAMTDAAATSSSKGSAKAQPAEVIEISS